MLPLHPSPLTGWVWDLLLTAMTRSVKLTLKMCAVPGTQQAVEPDNWYQEHLILAENKSSSVKVKRVFYF